MYRFRLFAALAVVAAGFVGSGGLAAPQSAFAAGKVPTCATISPAVVKAALGGSPGTPSSSSGTDSFLGYKQSTVGCTYSSAVTITYSTPATSAAYKSALATLKKATQVSVVTGIGNGAFTGTGTNTVCSPKCKTVVTDNIWVLVTGSTFFEISASKVTFAKEEALAKKMVPLV
jgi:hypothetical protein